jgi:hypothetical protein
MSTVIQIVGWWTLLSCILGPLFTWAFFKFDREERHIDSSREETPYARGWATSNGLRGPT